MGTISKFSINLINIYLILKIDYTSSNHLFDYGYVQKYLGEQ
jgi:hypothetical protein